jgi:hypothetical protein
VSITHKYNTKILNVWESPEHPRKMAIIFKAEMTITIRAASVFVFWD